MILIAIAVIALHRRIRALSQQHAARQHQQGLAELARIPRLAEPTPPTSPDTMPKPLVLQEISTRPGQTDEGTDHPTSLISTSELVPSHAVAVIAPCTPGYSELKLSTRNQQWQQ